MPFKQGIAQLVECRPWKLEVVRAGLTTLTILMLLLELVDRAGPSFITRNRLVGVRVSHNIIALLAQLVEALALEARCSRFESGEAHQICPCRPIGRVGGLKIRLLSVRV